MEELKELQELTKIDETHLLIGQLTGSVPDLARLHQYISSISMHLGVPEEIRGQFNIARNMALYQYFFYALAPEVQLKTYAVDVVDLDAWVDEHKNRGRAIKEVLWPENEDSTNAQTRLTGGSTLSSPMGAEYAKALGFGESTKQKST